MIPDATPIDVDLVRDVSPMPQAMMHALRRINAVLLTLSRTAIVALTLALIALIGVIDYITGLEISLSVFHLLPVSIAAWYGAKRDGIWIALAASLIWSGEDLFFGNAQGHPGIFVWDFAMHFVFLWLSATVIGMLRHSLALEQLMARTDPLTGLLNVRAFHERLSYTLALSARDGRPFTLAYVDLDDFKSINDLHGHGRGDLALSVVGKVMTEIIRDVDTAARIGGDEFALLFPATGNGGAMDILAKIARRLETSLSAIYLPITCSIGAVTFPRPPNSADDAIAATDSLMYHAKRGGKNNVAFGVFDHINGKVVDLG